MACLQIFVAVPDLKRFPMQRRKIVVEQPFLARNLRLVQLQWLEALLLPVRMLG